MVIDWVEHQEQNLTLMTIDRFGHYQKHLTMNVIDWIEPQHKSLTLILMDWVENYQQHLMTSMVRDWFGHYQ